MTHRATRAERRQAERDRARRGQDTDDVLAQDELARERLASVAMSPPGLLRRLAQRSASGGVPASSVFVEIYAPTHHEANLVREAQRLMGHRPRHRAIRRSSSRWGRMPPWTGVAGEWSSAGLERPVTSEQRPLRQIGSTSCISVSNLLGRAPE